MEEFTELDLLDEIYKHFPSVPKRTGGITAEEYAEEEGMRPRTAYAHLAELVKKEIFYRERQRCEDGRIRWVHYKNN